MYGEFIPYANSRIQHENNIVFYQNSLYALDENSSSFKRDKAKIINKLSEAMLEIVRFDNDETIKKKHKHSVFYISNYKTRDNMEIFKTIREAKKRSVNGKIHQSLFNNNKVYLDGSVWKYNNGPDLHGIVIEINERD
jgi:hypothetical protein